MGTHMRIQGRALRAASLLAAVGLACHQPPPDGPAPAEALVGQEWELVELQGQMVPLGENRQHLSLYLSADSNTASGYAGCNQFTGTYTLAADSLTFGPLAVTRMYCENTQALEDAYLKALEAVTRHRMVKGKLELLAGTAMVARFKR